MRYGLSAMLAVALLAPSSFAALSSNMIGGGDFEDVGTTVYTADSGENVIDYTYFKHKHSPRTQAEVNGGLNPVRAWQFHPDFDYGRWITVWGAGGAYPGDYDGMTGLSTYADPRSYWNPNPTPPGGTWTAPVNNINISEDPLSAGNHVMEGVSFRSHAAQIFQAPVNHIPGTGTIDFDYYFNNWTGLPPYSPNTDAASIFHIWIWSFPQSDLPTWGDRFGMPQGSDATVGFPNATPVWNSPNWEEWGWSGWGDDQPAIFSLGDQWNDFSVDHPDRTTFEVSTLNPYYYVSVWECVYSEYHPYFFMEGGKPADSMAAGIDNIDLRLQVSVPGDFNNDGICNLLDINDFVTAIVNLPAYMATYPYAHIPTIDPSQMGAPGDPVINLVDIPYFVDIITGGSGEVTELPEPATVGLIAMGALALLRRRTA